MTIRTSYFILAGLLASCTIGNGPPPVAPPTTCTTEAHAWKGYHLPHNGLSPVVRNRSGYTPDLVAWNNLVTPIHLRADGAGFPIEIEEGGDADSSWLGLASVRIGGDGHIVSAGVTMNRTLLARYGPRVAAHVLCQEMGHLLGLDHQRQADDSCMDDCQGRGSGWLQCLDSEDGATPNAHDAEQLSVIYEHAVDGAPPPVSCSGDTLQIHAFPSEDRGGHGH